jgi:hypothetical protein
MSKLVHVLFVFALAPSAHATIYIADVEPATRAVAMAVISSGPVVTYDPPPMAGVKGIGFVGWSGLASNVSPKLNAKVFDLMAAGAPVDQVETVVDSAIHKKYSRFMFISTNGTAGYVFPPSGCAQPECGVMVDPTHEFLVMGGGLQHDVVPKTVAAYGPVHANLNIPVECKMLIGLQTIIAVGGEIEEFQEARIGVDRPDLAAQEMFKSTAGEAGIIADLGSQIEKAGIHCPPMPLGIHAMHVVRKARRDPRSRDL